jgi:hypothetical protein
MKLYKRRANLHHYTGLIEREVFDSAVRKVDGVVEEYAAQERL